MTKINRQVVLSTDPSCFLRRVINPEFQVHFGTYAKTLLGLLIATFVATACRSAATPEGGDMAIPKVDVVVVSTLTPTKITDVEAPDPVPARDAALAYLSDQYGGQALPPDLPWTEDCTQPEGIARLVTCQYTAEGRAIAVTYPMVSPTIVVFGVVVTNETDGFQWQGTVDGSGWVTEQLAADDIQTARDAALAYLSKQYGEEAPEAGLTWVERHVAPEVLVGSGIYFYTAEDWVVTISYPVVPPEMVVYHVAVVNKISGFGWGGWVDDTGHVTEATDSMLAARDTALAYIRTQYSGQAPVQGATWIAEIIGIPVPEGPGGAGTFQYTYTAGEWGITISFQLLASKPVSYQVVVTNRFTGFYWQGEVNPAGQVTEEVAPNG
jgi:hypothetical protein